ncbi:MAG: hypothetical protein KF752_20730 [Pirellulaceae bacterium]|nr:hypothetical protein [Pirellulaceae bacterium]
MFDDVNARVVSHRKAAAAWAAALFLTVSGLGCTPITPRPIRATRVYQSPRMVSDQPQIQRGQRRPIIDGVGWLVGIPGKILLWDRRVDNHSIGAETEQSIAQYIAVNDLSTVRVRLNQYRPLEDWERLIRNDSTGVLWRLTFGTVSVLGETLLPGRIFGGDHYNPYTDTIHLYSDIPAIALHEGGHAKDFARRRWKGTYAFAYALPVVPLYHESIASSDVLAYLEAHGTTADQAAAARILYPAYGTYVGNAAGTFAPSYGGLLYYGSLIAGHALGRSKARQLLQLPEAELADSSWYLSGWKRPSGLSHWDWDYNESGATTSMTGRSTVEVVEAEDGHRPQQIEH